MEQEREVKQAGNPKRMMIKAASLGAFAAIVTLGTSTASAAIGAAVGSLAAGFYSIGYLRSHLASAGNHVRPFDAGIAKQAMFRLVLVGMLGLGAYSNGRPAFIAYLSSFALCFAVLIVSEIPRATKQLRAKGLIG